MDEKFLVTMPDLIGQKIDFRLKFHKVGFKHTQRYVIKRLSIFIHNLLLESILKSSNLT